MGVIFSLLKDFRIVEITLDRQSDTFWCDVKIPKPVDHSKDNDEPPQEEDAGPSPSRRKSINP